MRVWAVKGDRTTEPRRDGGITARPQTTALRRRLRRRRQRDRGAAGDAALFASLCSGVSCGFWRRNVFKVRTLSARAASCYCGEATADTGAAILPRGVHLQLDDEVQGHPHARVSSSVTPPNLSHDQDHHPLPHTPDQAPWVSIGRGTESTWPHLD